MRENLGLYLSKRAHLGPQQEALVEVERNQRFTYQELNQRANRIAHALAAKGVVAGDRVAVLTMNGVEFIESYFGLAKIGAVMVPLNWRLVADELSFILGDSGSKVLIFDTEFDAVATELSERDTSIETFVRVGGEANLGFAEAYGALTAGASPEEPEIAAEGDDLLFIMYTSGTTGLPKGAVHTHSSMAASSITMNMTADMRHGDRYLQMLPLFHVGALAPLTGSIHRAATVILFRSFDPAAVFPTIERERVTSGLAVPAMLNFMLAVNNHEDHDRSSLRWLMSGAAPVPDPADRKVRGAGHRDSSSLRAHRDRRACLPDRFRRRHREGGLNRPRLLPHRRSCRLPRWQGGRSGRNRRSPDPRAAPDEGVLEPPRCHGLRPWWTVGCTQAIWPASTTTASSTSRIARRT